MPGSISMPISKGDAASSALEQPPAVAVDRWHLAASAHGQVKLGNIRRIEVVPWSTVDTLGDTHATVRILRIVWLVDCGCGQRLNAC